MLVSKGSSPTKLARVKGKDNLSRVKADSTMSIVTAVTPLAWVAASGVLKARLLTTYTNPKGRARRLISATPKAPLTVISTRISPGNRGIGSSKLRSYLCAPVYNFLVAILFFFVSLVSSHICLSCVCLPCLASCLAPVLGDPFSSSCSTPSSVALNSCKSCTLTAH